MQKLNYLITAALFFTIYVSFGQGVEMKYGFTDGKVQAIKTDANYVYKAGSFVRAFNTSDERGHGVLTNPDGDILSFPEVNGRIRTIIPDGDGGWYIGGDFSYIGTLNRNHMAHILSDLSVDPDFSPSFSTNVYEIVMDGDSLLVGGQFSNVNGTPTSRLVKINRFDGELSDWLPIINGNVSGITVEGDSLYVAGTFTSVGAGLTRNRFAKVNKYTAEFGDLAPEFNLETYESIIVGDSLVIGGTFTLVNGATRNRLVKIHKETGVMSDSWNPNANRVIDDLYLDGDTLYVAGWFDKISGLNVGALAKVNIHTGAVDPTFDINTGVIRGDFKRVSALDMDADGNIYIGGYFQKVGSSYRAYVAKINKQGELDPTYNPGLNDRVNALTVTGDHVLIGGDFHAAGGAERVGMVRFKKSDGDYDSWTVNTDNTVTNILVDGDSIYLGGNFYNVNGEARTGLAKVSTTSGDVGGWNPSVYGVQKMVLEGDSLFLGGYFSQVNGEEHNYLAKVHKNTGIKGTWHPQTNGSIYDMIVDGDSIYIGGNFITINSESRGNLTKVHKITGEVGGFNAEADDDVWVMSMSGDSLIIGGRFSTVKGESRVKLAKINRFDGNVSPSFSANLNNLPYDIIDDGDHIFVAGYFSYVGGSIADEIVRLDKVTGTRDASYNFQTLGAVFDIHKDGDQFYAGGIFSKARGAKKYCSVVYSLGDDINLYYAGTFRESGATLTFPDQAINTTSDKSQVYIYNHGIENDLLLTGSSVMTLTGDDPDDFVLDTVVINKTISPNSSTFFHIKFAPSTGGSKNATLQIENSTTNESVYEINLTGFAVKNDQTITFEPLSSKTYGDSPFTLTATSDSGLPVSFKSKNTSIATISGDELTIVGAGEVQIAAFQDGDDSYNEADTVFQTLTINKAEQIITFSDIATKTFGDVDFDLEASSDAGLPVTFTTNNDLVSIDGSTITINGAGNVTITAHQEGNTNYSPAETVEKELVVNKADQTISFSALTNKTYGDDDFDLGGSSSSTLELSYSSDNESVITVSGSTATIVGVGNANITASQAGDDNYNTADPVQQSITIEKGTQTITFPNPGEKSLDEETFELNASASSGLTISYESSNESILSIDGNIATMHTEGTVDITVRQIGNDNYLAADPVMESVTIKTGQTITFDALNEKSIGDDSFTLEATASSGLTVAYTSSNEDVATVSGDTVTIIGAGTTVIVASQAGNETYVAAEDVSQELVVNKLDQQITFSALESMTFGDDDLSLSATSDAGLSITYSSSNENVATISGNLLTIVGAGSTEITASQAGDDTYNASQASQSLIVNKMSQEINLQPVSNLTFGDDPIQLDISSSSGLDVTLTSSNPDVLSIEGNIGTILGAGSVTVIANQSGNDNYEAASETNIDIAIAKGTPTLTFDIPNDKVYGDSAFELEFTSNSTGSVTLASADTEIVSISNNQITIVGAGLVELTATISATDDYEGLSVTKQLAIAKKSQSISFSLDNEINYTTTPLSLNGIATSELVVSYQTSDAEVATIEDGNLFLHNTGEVSITAIQIGDENYEAADEVTVTIQVVANSQTINFEEISDLTYGVDAFQISATASSGLPVSFVSSNESILTIEDDIATVHATGLVEITAFQNGSDLFNSTSATQTVTINKASQSITFSLSDTFEFSNEPVELNGTSTSGLLVTYESSDTEVALIDGDQLSFIKPGTVTITASQVGDNNFLPGEAVAIEISITKAQQTISFNAIPSEVEIGDSFELTAEATSGLGISFSSSNTAVIVISGNTAEVVGEGEATITASQSGDDVYEAAISIEQTITIESATVLSSQAGIEAISIYPNPTTDYIKVNLTSEAISILIYDQKGTLVLQNQVIGHQEIDVNGLEAGVYLVQVKLKNQLFTQRLVKQ